MSNPEQPLQWKWDLDTGQARKVASEATEWAPREKQQNLFDFADDQDKLKRWSGEDQGQGAGQDGPGTTAP